MPGFNKRGPNGDGAMSGLKKGPCAGAAGDRGVVTGICRGLAGRFQSGRHIAGRMVGGYARCGNAAFRSEESAPRAELDHLKAEAKTLKDAIQAIHNQIDRMEKTSDS